MFISGDDLAGFFFLFFPPKKSLDFAEENWLKYFAEENWFKFIKPWKVKLEDS